ncbi:uncharacterized protein LOC117645478 isoform X2 [Thrips palmi]|uniref:Uncharacterized protein LOC117645478 isoform X2 n=1 Tax=Thrips palmi TaxID=161013 RepID=A0A6P8Z4T9_THRPL|nr:uncharacterized protein LOC117645478 isoform X2 [Thrips palmi]
MGCSVHWQPATGRRKCDAHRGVLVGRRCSCRASVRRSYFGLESSRPSRCYQRDVGDHRQTILLLKSMHHSELPLHRLLYPQLRFRPGKVWKVLHLYLLVRRDPRFNEGAMSQIFEYCATD